MVEDQPVPLLLEGSEASFTALAGTSFTSFETTIVITENESPSLSPKKSEMPRPTDKGQSGDSMGRGAQLPLENITGRGAHRQSGESPGKLWYGAGSLTGRKAEATPRPATGLQPVAEKPRTQQLPSGATASQCDLAGWSWGDIDLGHPINGIGQALPRHDLLPEYPSGKGGS